MDRYRYIDIETYTLDGELAGQMGGQVDRGWEVSESPQGPVDEQLSSGFTALQSRSGSRLIGPELGGRILLPGISNTGLSAQLATAH